MKRNFIITFALALLFILFRTPSTKAATIIFKSFEEVVNGSELIFEGKVLSKETRLSPMNDMPFTYFIFEIIDIVKGDYTEQTIEIGFMGGPKGDLILKVSDMQMPEVGERGIYFLTTHSEQYIHPLSGWHQGHYLIISSEQTGMDVIVPVKQQEIIKIPSRAAHLLTVDDFKQRIRSVIWGEQ